MVRGLHDKSSPAYLKGQSPGGYLGVAAQKPCFMHLFVFILQNNVQVTVSK